MAEQHDTIQEAIAASDELSYSSLFEKISAKLNVMPIYNNRTIGMETEIYKDLGLYGFDFFEFFMWVEDFYNVTIRFENLSEYCPSENGLEPLRHLLCRIMKRQRDYSKYKSMKVKDVIGAIRNAKS